MKQVSVTKEQLHILKHSVANRSRSKSYRDYYCCSPEDKRLNELCDMGLMRRGQIINDGSAQYFHVTDEGWDFMELNH